MAPSKNTSMNSSEGQLNHDGFHSARGRTVGTFITNTLEGAVGSARKSFEGRRHRRSRRKSEDIDPLDRAEELQDHNNHRPRQSHERRFPDRFTDKTPERKRQRSSPQHQHQYQHQQQQQQQQQHHNDNDIDNDIDNDDGTKKCTRCIRGPSYKRGHDITCPRSQKHVASCNNNNNQQKSQRKEKDDQLSYKQRNRNNNEKYQKTDNSIESVLEQLSHSKSSATVDLCCSDNEDNATEDDGDNLEVESKSKSGGKQRYHKQSERSSDNDDDDDDDDDDEVKVVSKSSVSKFGGKQRYHRKSSSDLSPSENEGENESGNKHFRVMLDARITKKCDDSVNNNNNDSGGGGRRNKINRDGLDRRENSYISSDEEGRTQHKRHLNNEEVHTTADSCSNNEKKLSNRRQEKTSDEGKIILSDDEQKSNDEMNSDSHRSDSCQQPREEKVDKKRRPQSSDEPSDERNIESHFRNSKQPSQQQKKRGKSQKKNTSIVIKIPKLKNSSHSSKYKPRTVDSDSDDDDFDDDRKQQQPKPKNDGSLDLLKMVEAAESNDFDLQGTTSQRRNRDSTTMDMDTACASTSNSMSQDSSFSLFNIRKVGKKKKLKGGKIIPGQAIMNSSYNYSEPIQEKTRRREEDRDEYHNGMKGDNIQYSGTNNWNPLNGSRYSDQQNTRSSSTRVNSTLSSSLSQESTNRTPSARRIANRDTEFSSQESSRNKRRSRRNNKTQKNDKTPETIDITNSDSDSDDDDIVMEDNQIMEFTLKRLAINNKVRNQEDHQPMIKFDFESNTMLLSFIKSKVDVTKGRSEILIGMGDVQEMSYFEMNDAAVQNNIDLDLDSFIYLHAEAERPGVRSRTQNYKFELEFEEDEHLHDLIQAVGDSGILTPTQTQPEDIEIDAKALIEDSRKKYKLRSRATPQKKDPFIANKKDDDILLVYPFGEDKNKIEAAASDLTELLYKQTYNGQDSTEPKQPSTETKDLSTAQGSQRSHQIVIRVEDYEKLEDGQWLNDSLVDFWMQWISHDINFNCKSTDVHFFTSHFHSTLASDGVEGVKSWTVRKNINIFEKKLIFIPINKTLHWSLCVIVNPGAVEKSNLISVEDDKEDSPLSCMLFFDSLKMHNKTRSQRLLLKWLNSEWQRVNDISSTPFTIKNYQIYDPEVPRQDNGSDCGVFVCRYALAMFKLRHLEFTNKEAGIEKGSDSIPTGHRFTRRTSTRRNGPFSRLITNGEDFDFNCRDIRRIRTGYQTFIRNLHPLYDQFNKAKIETEKEERKARKESRRKGKVEATAATGPSSIDEDQKENAVTGVHTSTTNGTKENLTDIHTLTINETKENLVADIHTSTMNETKENLVTDVRISTTNETSEIVKHPLEDTQDEATKRASLEGPLEQVVDV